MKRVYLTDFDGTITMIDTNDAMADTFAPSSWREIDGRWSRGEISTQEAMEQILSMVDATPEELDGFFRSIPLDPKFNEFVQWAEERGEPIYILSDGIDFSIKRVLKQHGVDHIPFYSNKVCFQGKEIGIYTSKDRIEGCLYGTCKCLVLEQIREKHPHVQMIYIGDGYSDACVAPKADRVFAKGVLAEHCQKEKIDFFPFENFGDIMEEIEKQREEGRG